MISFETAQQISLAYREISVAEELLTKISEAISRREVPDIRDSYGRQAPGLQLGVPDGDDRRRLFNVPWNLARPIIEAHITQQKALIDTLSEKARVELGVAV